ncbi:MAG: endonuclease MutS2 [Oscillospiraceae bacterium]
MPQTDKSYITRLEFDKICALICEYAVSGEAKRRVLTTEPATELSDALEQLALTDALFCMLAKNSSPQISSCGEIPEICMRAQKGGSLSCGELLHVKTMLRNGRALGTWYSDELDSTGAASRVFYGLYEDTQLERSLNDAILSDTELADDASPALKDIRKRIARAENSVREKLDSVIRSASTSKYLQDAIVTMRAGRFVVPVKLEHKNAVKGLVHDVSSSGSTLFVEPAAVVEANNLIMQLRGDERAETEKILAAFSALVSDIADRLRASYDSFVEIDLALAKAKYGLANDCSCPQLNTDGVISLKRARHPLISKSIVVPIDLPLGKGYNQLVITGPNTGGKTVTLKTVGLLTLMACSGMLIPAGEGSELSVFDRVLADIGDEQSIEQSLSTFSAHVTNIAQILKQADRGSLVLLDELGAGTDPAEGAALAVAILKRLRSLGSRVLATTHYGEIKIYALETDGVQNASSEFDVKTLRPTYRLNIGIPGRSNALLIGERLGLDAELLDDARRNMTSQDRQFEDMMREIESLKTEISDKEKEIELEREKALAIVEKAKIDRDKLIAQGNRELDAARLRAKQLAADVSAGAYRLLDEIKQLDAQKDKDRAAAKSRAKAIANTDSFKLSDLADVDAEILADTLEKLTQAAVGDHVFVAALGRVGVVTREADSKGYFEVKSGNIKTRVDLSGLRRAPAAAVPKAASLTRSPQINVESRRSGKSEVNLIGMNVEEAIEEAERFIDSAMLSHISQVYLIHGKGTGALRAALHKQLKTMKNVVSFRIGVYGEGEAGVTIVELK